MKSEKKYLRYKFDKFTSNLYKDYSNVLSFHNEYVIYINNKILPLIFKDNTFQIADVLYSNQLHINEMTKIVTELNSEYKELLPLIELGLL